MAEQINKDRLNQLLGIQEGQSFEDYMNDGTSTDETQSVIDQTAKLIEETKEKVDEIEGQFQHNIQVIDDAKNQIQTTMKDGDGSASVRIDNMVNVESAFKSIEDLVDTTKQMIGTVYSIISSCDVLDSETVSAAASLITSTKQLIAEYLGLYKQRVKFFDNVKMETLKQQHRLELMERKYQLDEEKWNRQNTKPAEAEEVTGQGGNVPPGMVEAGSVDMLKLLQEMDDEDDEVEILEGDDSSETDD
jgi:hypothetical protein